MQEIFYADIYFIVNFGMDLIALSLTGQLMKIRASSVRFITAAALGSLWATLGVTIAVFTSHAKLYAGLSAALSFVMCFVAFGKMIFSAVELRRFLSGWLLFIGICALLGGLMTSSFIALGEIAPEGVASDEQPIAVFLITASVACAVSYIFSRVTQSRSRRRSAEVTITVNGRSASFTALIDSGNLLREAVSGRGVAVISRGAVSGIIPPDFDFNAENSDIADSMKTRVRIIAVDRLNGRSMRYALIPDKFTVDGIERSLLFTAEDVPADSFGGFAGTLNV